MDLAVYLDSWVGSVKYVNSRMILQFSDGSRCVVRDPDGVVGFEVFDEKKDNVSTIHVLYKKIVLLVLESLHL